MIHTPYHFVPLSDWVYMPDWAHLVSHDVPFEDGYSGTIEYTLTNATPLCVGAEIRRKQGAAAEVLWAKDPAGKLVIPGSSIKGMLRNVLQIAAFGKLNQIYDSRFSYRDISSGSHYLKNVIEPNKVVSGWIKYNQQREVWEFRACQNAKLKYKDLNNLLNVGLKDSFSAVAKYKTVPLSQAFYASISSPTGKAGNRWAESISESGSKELVAGHAVFTNKKVTTKQSDDYEFCYFFHSVSEEHEYEDVTSLVTQLFASHDENWVSYLKLHPQPEFGIPVFMLLNKSTKKPQSFGLARMPRVSYKNSVQDLVKRASQGHVSDAFFDLSELIFGNLRENGLGLKSRVSFSDLVEKQDIKSQTYLSNYLVLNEPKPTFFPAYLEQQSNTTYYDYDNTDARLKGWKRYISKRPEHKNLTQVNQLDKANVSSRLELVAEGATFAGKMTFHNLKAAELGALLWVIEFEKKKGCFHSLGHGKPFGAGAIRLSISHLDLRPNAVAISTEPTEFIHAFVDEINSCHPTNTWYESPALKNLIAMATLVENNSVNTAYMSIDKRDFQNAKNRKEKLEPFKMLPRRDSLKKSDNVSLAFGKGRLASLVDMASTFNQELTKSRSIRAEQLARQIEKQLVEQQQRQQQAEKEKALQSLSPGMQSYVLLKEELNVLSGQEKPPKLRLAVQSFLDNAWCKESAEKLYMLVRQHEFHKTPKKKVEEHKEMLARLVTKYRISI